MDCSTAKCFSSDQDSYPSHQGKLPRALTNWAISPPPVGDVESSLDECFGLENVKLLWFPVEPIYLLNSEFYHISRQYNIFMYPR